MMCRKYSLKIFHVSKGHHLNIFTTEFLVCFFVEVLWSSQPSGVMSSMVNLSNYTFTGQA